MADTPRRVRVAANTLSREVQGETVLLQLDRGEYFGLDEIGTRVWQLITERGDLDAVRAALAEEFDADADQISLDLRELVDALLERQLLVADSH